MELKKRSLGGLLLTLCLTAMYLIVGVGPANATGKFDYPGAISDVNVTFNGKDGGQARVDDEVKVTAKWNVPNEAQAGQTFGMTLPKEFSNYGNGEFSVPDKETGETVANCKVTNDPAPVVTCTLTDFVNGKEDVGGELWFLASLDEQSDNDTADFIIDGKTVPVPIPGDGGIGPVGPGYAADTPYKYSARTKIADDLIAWGIQFPNTIAEDGTVTVTDAIVDNTEFERHKANDFGVEVEYRNVAEDGTFVEGEEWAPVDKADFETDIAEGNTNFTVTVKNVPTDKRVQYRVLYWTKMDGKAFEGDVFKNTAKVNGRDADATFTYTAIGGGTGSGKEYTRFSIAKAVEGNGAEEVPGGTKYTVKYTAADEEDTLEFEAGEENRVNSKRYKIGTEFKITEVNLPEVDGIEWGEYEITGDGVTKNEDGSFSVIPETNEPAKLTLVNKAEKKVQNGNLSVIKTVTGDGADLVPADTEYNVKYSYELDGEEKTGTLTVKND
ncbi:Ig-like domain-containing protein [Corynebacterium aurimucosum]